MQYIVGLLHELDIYSQVSHCLVNTAYSNSQAQNRISQQKINGIMVPTGVKNAHPVVQKYVIGANDEPNGHGTICVKWDELKEALKGKEDQMAARKLKALLRISNIYVGDAIANLLMIEAVLRDMNYSIQDFSKLYQEYPSKMFKAVVNDRTAFKTTWDETRLVSPASLQAFIDNAVS